jgi:type III restriction enzyme
MDKLMPPLVPQLRRKVKEFRDGVYVGASDTSKSLLNWWLKEPYLLPQIGASI